MARILAIDYGIKRCGLAMTDILKISINPLPTEETTNLLSTVLDLLSNEEIEMLVVGNPVHKDGNPTYLKKHIDGFLNSLKSEYKKEIDITFVDESFTSSEAKDLILKLGVKKKERRNKALIDQMSAMLILQRYLNKKFL